MPVLSLRIDFESGGRIGPGKVVLLERIAEHGSISAAARAIGMSYKRAWDLVEDLNALYGKPVVATQSGGKKGGGARLTPIGDTIVQRFRAIEAIAMDAAQTHLSALQEQIDVS